MLFHPHLCSGCRSVSPIKEQGGKWGSCFGVITFHVKHISSPPRIICHVCCEAGSRSRAEIRQEKVCDISGYDLPIPSPFHAMLLSDSMFRLSGQVYGVCQAFVHAVYGPWVSPARLIWKLQLNRDFFDFCRGGSRWKDGQMGEVMSVTGTVSCDC